MPDVGQLHTHSLPGLREEVQACMYAMQLQLWFDVGPQIHRVQGSLCRLLAADHNLGRKAVSKAHDSSKIFMVLLDYMCQG